MALAAMAMLAAAVGWLVWPVPKSSKSPVVAAATSFVPIAAPRPSIVVLPFANLSNDPRQQYFVDGITEDLTTDLSRMGTGMLVISRDSAFTYKDKAVSAQQIGRELAVRYVLEGSVQRSGNEVRVNAQLIDAETDTHLWAERFDRDIGDLFALQDEITGRIANALNLELIAVEAARPTEHPDALGYIYRGRAGLQKTPSRANDTDTIDLFERALTLDPRSAEAESWLAIALTRRALNHMSVSPAADLTRAEGLIGQALTISPSSPLAHFAKGLLLREQGRPEEAMLEFEAVLAFDPNQTSALYHLGWCKWITGSIDEVIPLAERGIRLSPRAPFVASWYLRIGWVHLLLSHIDEAILWFEKARSADPGLAQPHVQLAAAYGLKGETSRGAAELSEARRILGAGSFASIARLRNGYWGVPKVRALVEATYFAGLRKVGVPEE